MWPMIDRRLVENFDWPLLWVLLAIIAVGLTSIYSALFVQIQSNPTGNLFVKQLVWLTIGFMVLFGTLLIDYQRLRSISGWVYLFLLFLLILVLLVGKEVNGAKRWLQFGGFQFQPSEFMKVAIVMQISAYFASQDVDPYPHLKKLLPALVMLFFPVLLILAGPDLGTAMVVLIVGLTVVLFMGLRWRYVLIAALVILAALYPVWHHVLKPYQKTRILTLFSPELDPLGAGYHIRQSKIAIGSGMTWGKGFLNGTQNKLRFLPEKHTDFVFSVWAEERGFVGCVLLLFLFGCLVFLSLRVARRSRDRFGSLLVVGMTGLIFWQALINIGMVIGLLPVVGITLPFVSYGGSSLITLCFAAGVIQNVSMRRYSFHTQ